MRLSLGLFWSIFIYHYRVYTYSRAFLFILNSFIFILKEFMFILSKIYIYPTWLIYIIRR